MKLHVHRQRAWGPSGPVRDPRFARATAFGPLVDPDPIGTSLRAICRAQWLMDEESDGSVAVQRNDTSGNGRHLSDVNTTPSVAGFAGLAANFEPITDRAALELSLPNTAAVVSGNNWWTGWVYFADAGTYRDLIVCNSYGPISFGFRRFNTNLLNLYVTFTGGTANVSHGTAVSSGVWYFVCLHFDSTGAKSRISLDAGSFAEAASSGTLNSAGGATYFGNRLPAAFDSFPGRMSRWRAFSGAPTQEQLDYLKALDEAGGSLFA